MKSPLSRLAVSIPQLSHLAGIAGLLDPTSADTERLVKEHKCVAVVFGSGCIVFVFVRRIVRDRFTRGYNETHVAAGKPDHSGMELRLYVPHSLTN